MGRIDRYLLSQFLMLFGFFALVLVLVYWVNRAVLLFDQLIADGQNFSVFLVMTALTLPNVIRLVLPTAAFAATLYVINRMSNESELVVAQSTGFNGFRLARPAVIFGVIVAAMMAILVHVLVPASLAQLETREAEVSENITARLLNEGEFQHPAEGMTFYLREITADGELLDVFLADTRDPEQQIIYSAKRAFLVRSDDGPKLAMIDGMVQRLDRDSQILATTTFADFVSDLNSFDFSVDGVKRDERQFTTYALLTRPEAEFDALKITRSEAYAEIHERSANALSALTFVLIGYATLITAGFSRFGIWPRLVVAVMLLLVLQVLFGAAETSVRKTPEMWPLWYVPFGGGIVFAVAVLWWGTLSYRRKPEPSP